MVEAHETIPNKAFYDSSVASRSVQVSFGIAVDGYFTDLTKIDIDDKKGIYFVFAAIIGERGATLNKLIYIGQGKNLRERLSKHEKYEEFKRKCDKDKGEVLVYYSGKTGALSSEYLDWCEAAVITEYENRPEGKDLINKQHEDSYGYKTAQVTLSRDPQSRIAEEPLPSMLYPFEFIVFQDVGDAKPKS